MFGWRICSAGADTPPVFNLQTPTHPKLRRATHESQPHTKPPITLPQGIGVLPLKPSSRPSSTPQTEANCPEKVTTYQPPLYPHPRDRRPRGRTGPREARAPSSRRPSAAEGALPRERRPVYPLKQLTRRGGTPPRAASGMPSQTTNPQKTNPIETGSPAIANYHRRPCLFLNLQRVRRKCAAGAPSSRRLGSLKVKAPQRGHSPASIIRRTPPMRLLKSFSPLRSGMLRPRCGRRNRRSSRWQQSHRRAVREPR